jgi:hypothetical protein
MTTHTENCLICGAELEYTEDTGERGCVVCGALAPANASCKRGHFVCDACHGSSGLELIQRVSESSTGVDPVALATELMRSPRIAMHGPEHHYLVPAVLLATFDNVLGRSDRKAADLAEARRRAERVPGGFCGSHGNCGAGVGTGIFWSIATGTTPLEKSSWSECNRLTARSLLRIAEHGGPRCCKRDTWHALLQTLEDIGQRVPETGWATLKPTPRCEHSARNKQCLGAACEFHPS